MTAAFDWIAHYTNTTPNAPALRDLGSGRSYTYAQLNDRVARVAGVLKSRGIAKGDRVAFLAYNSTDIAEILFACWRVGAICTALNFRLTVAELETILQDCTPKIVFHDVTLPIPDTPNIDWIATDGLGGDSAYEQALATASPCHIFTAQTFDDDCLLLYSSGTTGRPKGIPLTHGNLFHAAAATAPRLGTGPSTVGLAALPLFHIGALGTSLIPMILAGGSSVILRTFDPAAALAAINDPHLGITALFFVPATLNALRQHACAETTDFSRITLAITGGETVPADLLHWFQSRGVPLREGWAMTETAGSAVMLDPAEAATHRGSTGKPFPGLHVRIADAKGTECPRNTSGEIQIRGPQTMHRYWNNDAATAAAFIGDWFRTGDIGRMDVDGYLYIEDRLKDMYISGGENVYPAEVENILHSLPQISDVAVIGVPHPRWGETGCACVVLAQGETLTLEDIQSHCTGKLAKYKHPTQLFITDEIPRGATGKALKFQLRKILAAPRD